MIPDNLSLSDKLYSIDDLLEQAQTESERHQSAKKKLFTTTAINHLTEIRNNQAELSELKSNYKKFSAVLQHIGSQIEVLSPKDFKRYQELTKLVESKPLEKNELEELPVGPESLEKNKSEGLDKAGWEGTLGDLLAVGDEALAKVPSYLKKKFEREDRVKKIRDDLRKMDLSDDSIKSFESTHAELLKLADALLAESKKLRAESAKVTKKSKKSKPPKLNVLERD